MLQSRLKMSVFLHCKQIYVHVFFFPLLVSQSGPAGSIPTLRADTLLHKPSSALLSPHKSRLHGLLMRAQAHGKVIPEPHGAWSVCFKECCISHTINLFIYIFDFETGQCFCGIRLWGFPLHKPTTLLFMHTTTSLSPHYIHIILLLLWAMILHCMPHSWHTCISNYAPRVEVMPAWISILMGCPLCPCFLSLRFHSSEGEDEALQMGKNRERRCKMEERTVVWESHLNVIGTGGTNN